MKKMLALLLALAMMISLLAACGSSSTDDEEDTSSDTETTEETEEADDAEDAEEETSEEEERYSSVNIGTLSSMAVGHFDGIGLLSDNYCQPANYLVYDVLFYINEEGVQTSDILESWTWDDSVGDNGGIILVLKDYVYFANGDQMDAYDIVWSLNRSSQVARTATNMARFLLDEATVSDDGFTLTIPMTEAYSEWQVLVSGLVIMDGDYIDANGGDDYDYTDITLVNGSGPYSVVAYEEDISVTFEKRDDWWMEDEADGLATVQTITVTAYSDSNTMMIDYENGVIDAAIDLTYSDYDYVEADSSLGTAVKVNTNCVVNLVMDAEGNEYLQDETLRKAIAYGMDGTALGTLAYGSLSEEATGFVVSSNSYYVEGYTYDYDPEYAAELVEESSYDGEEILLVTTSGTNATIAEAFQAQMAEIGINITVEIYDAATCVVMWLEEGSTGFLFDHTSNANSSNSFNTEYLNVRATVDFPCYMKTDETWNDLLDSAMATTDADEIADLYAQFQEYAYEVCYVAPICIRYSAYAYGCSGVIEDLQIWDTTGPNLRYLTTSVIS